MFTKTVKCVYCECGPNYDNVNNEETRVRELGLISIQWCSRNSKLLLHEICLLIRELVIRGTKVTLNARLGSKVTC